MRIRELLPPRNIMILLLAVLAINPILNLYLASNPPEGKVFVTQWSEAYQLTYLRAVQWNFQDPWGEGWSVFHNPIATTAFVYVPLGTIPTLLGMPTWPYLMFLKIVIGFSLLIVGYNFCRRFAGQHSKTAFILFLISGSLGWILYGCVYFGYGQDAANIISYAFTTEFGEYIGGSTALAHLTQIYWMLPELTFLLAILLFSIKKRALAGLAAGLTFLFYPTFGIASAFSLGLYTIVENWGKTDFLKSAIRDLWKPAVLVAAFALPWIATYIQMKEIFQLYLDIFSSQLPVTLFLSSAILGGLALYEARSGPGVLRKPWYIVSFCLFSALLSLAYMYERAVAGNAAIMISMLQSLGIYGLAGTLFTYAGIIFLPVLFLLLFAAKNVLAQQASVTGKFVPLWALLVVAITIVPAAYAFWWPARMQWFLLLPLAILAAPALSRLASRSLPVIRSSHFRIFLLILLISLPTFIGFNYRLLRLSVQDDTVYLPQEDFLALKFLSKQPIGRLIASPQIAYNAPYISGQRSMASDLPDASNDILLFYSNQTPKEQRLEILEIRNFSYVFFGSFEKKLYGSASFDESGLQLIYDSGTKVYSVLET